MRRRNPNLVSLCVMLAAGAREPAAAAEPPPGKPVLTMSLEELVNVEVTSVSKKRESRLEAAAAISVITQEDIRRSGVTTLVEALRLAPGVEVARINSSQWAVGIRGFQSRFSRAVLVLIDGRSVYTPLFAGVYWEAQDTFLEDIERIEVIRGPGGSLWGANAVNGVINIITKKAGETAGGLVAAAGGSEDRFVGGARWGGTLGKTAFRVYGKYSDRDSQFHASGNDFDSWNMVQGGFRADTSVGPSDSLTLQGDAYGSRNGERAAPSSFTPPYVSTVDDTGHLSGANVLGRWTHTNAGGTELQAQAYYDHTHHAETIFREDRDTLDVDVQDRFRPFAGHEVTCGLGFRFSVSDTTSIPTVVISPARRSEPLYSAFVQDEIQLVPNRLRLTLGTKIEHNVYTGFEIQPTARLLWIPRDDHFVWAALSRAVRTPSRLEFDVSRSNAAGPTTPVFLRLSGDGQFESERVIAVEAGYRIRLNPRTVVDLALFHNDEARLTSGEIAGAAFAEGTGASARIIIPAVFRNGLEGKSRGVEIAADSALAPWVTVRASYAYLAIDLKPAVGSGDKTSGPNIEGSSPRHSVTLTGRFNLPFGLEADGTLRFVDRLPAQAVESYSDLDFRVGWRPSMRVEVSVVGQNLFRPHHFEFGGGESTNTEIQRALYGKVTVRF